MISLKKAVIQMVAKGTDIQITADLVVVAIDILIITRMTCIILV